ncbi:phage tail protein [Pseudomonas sp. PGPPP2]|uniref:phage tail protein n=1 Tax=Pseudomonas sp. PGPPP2 TaxID=2015554 RepID=UPI000BCD78A5|nr:phage tail protein [Pseudomonas sp. PGPPP2]OYT78239.1 MAG: hypothetical protein CFE48_16500 [Pseudomonas sp. PGPPP2]
MIDRNSQFMAILTNVGAAKLANANALGIPWNLTALGVGDANETDPVPNANQTKLINERRRAPLNQLRVDPVNAAVIVAEQVIPADIGGWWIREIGLYDADGDLVAVSNCAPSFKPALDQGSGRTQIVRMNFIVSSIANIVLKIDPAVVLATREYVDLAITEAMNKQDFKHSVLVATTANIVLSGLQTIDGVLLTAGARVLVKNQVQAKDNGLYVVPAAGAWKRAQDADVSVEVTPGLFVSVETGTVNGDSVWQLVTDAPIVLGTTALAFEMVAGRTGVVAGSYTRVTVDKIGRVIAGVSHNTLFGYGINDAYTKTEVDSALLSKADKSQLGTAAALKATTSATDATEGRALRVADFGLGGTVAPVVNDARSLEVSGIYSIITGTLGVPAAAGSGSMLWHMNHLNAVGNRTATQEIVTRSNPARKFWCARVNDVWGPWIESATSGSNSNITALTGLTERPSFGGNLAWDAGNFVPSSKVSGDRSTAAGFYDGVKSAPYIRHMDGTYVYLQVDRPKDTALLNTNGWSKNADTGEIIQWCEYAIGDAQGATSSITVTWPFQFPTQCLNIRTSFRVASGSPGRMIASSYALTTSGTTILLEEVTTAVQSGLVLMIEVRGN